MIYPPQQSLKEPVTVYVADYGVHSSLLLPTGDGRFVEYAFGDWGYAAQNHCLPQDAVGAGVVVPIGAGPAVFRAEARRDRAAAEGTPVEPRPGEL